MIKPGEKREVEKLRRAAEGSVAFEPNAFFERLIEMREDHNFFMRELAACVEAARVLAATETTAASGDFERIRLRALAVFEKLRGHNRMEEEEVYLWPRALLNGAERDELDAAVSRELDNLPPRFVLPRE